MGLCILKSTFTNLIYWCRIGGTDFSFDKYVAENIFDLIKRIFNQSTKLLKHSLEGIKLGGLLPSQLISLLSLSLNSKFTNIYQRMFLKNVWFKDILTFLENNLTSVP